MREKFESRAWYYEVGNSTGKDSNGNIPTGESFLVGGTAGEMSSKGKLHGRGSFLRVTTKQKGDPEGKISQGTGGKEIPKGEPHPGGEFL